MEIKMGRQIYFFFFLLFILGCDQKPKYKNKSLRKEAKDIELDTQRRTLDSNYIRIEKKDNVMGKYNDTFLLKKSIPEPTILSQFSETRIYYKNYIGKAYLQRDYNKYFKTNRKYLDSLIRIYKVDSL